MIFTLTWNYWIRHHWLRYYERYSAMMESESERIRQTFAIERVKVGQRETGIALQIKLDALNYLAHELVELDEH